MKEWKRNGQKGYELNIQIGMKFCSINFLNCNYKIVALSLGICTFRRFEQSFFVPLNLKRVVFLLYCITVVK